MKIMLIQILLNDFQCFVVPSAKTGTSHTNLYDDLLFHVYEDTKLMLPFSWILREAVCQECNLYYL
jgi:hypothetical protein